MRFSVQYLDYIHSSAWQTRRQRALELAGHRCQVCGRYNRLQVHHVSYANLGHETDRDLTVLCYECHTLFTWYKCVKKFFAWLGKGIQWIFKNR